MQCRALHSGACSPLVAAVVVVVAVVGVGACRQPQQLNEEQRGSSTDVRFDLRGMCE